MQRVGGCDGVTEREGWKCADWGCSCSWIFFFNVLLTVHLSISLDNDQLDAHLLCFSIRPLQSSTCFKHYMLIIRRLNCIDAASGIVLSVIGH